jgi:glycosyltransferase involved in cell wall biosynthesis
MHVPPVETTPAVSVVVPFLNEARHLGGAVDTVLAQTFTDWELVLVDDGSTDGSGAIADEWASAHPGRIRVVRHPGGSNRGTAMSRNLGIASARGGLVAWLDADDRWDPDKLEHDMALAARHPDVGMFCGPSWYVHEDGSRPPAPTAVVTDAPRRFATGAFARRMVSGRCESPCPASVVIRTEVLRAVGVPAGSNTHEDQRMFLAVNLVAPVLVEAVPRTWYTVRADSVTGSVDGDTIKRRHLEYENWVMRYAPSRGRAGLALALTLGSHRLRRTVVRRARLLASRATGRG